MLLYDNNVDESQKKVLCERRQSQEYILYCYFLINLFICLFLAVLGLCCCTWAFSSCGKQGLLFVVVQGLLIAVASLVAEHGL